MPAPSSRSRFAPPTIRAIATAIALATAAFTIAPRSAAANALSVEELGRLSRGETVTRAQTLDRDDRHYVGGITYTVVEAPPQELAALLDDIGAYRHILPKTKSAERVGMRAGDPLILLRQGTSLFELSYTIRVHKDEAGKNVHFWLDPTRPHGISDAWGFFRVEPFAPPQPPLPASGVSAQPPPLATPVRLPPRALLTYRVLVDMGDGLARVLFEERVRDAMLSVPQLVRGYVASVHARDPRRQVVASQTDR